MKRREPIPAGTPHMKAAAEAGGCLIGVNLRMNLPPPDNGGCGELTHVEGTNGGQMRCGSALKHLDGKEAPYYCARCRPREPEKKGMSEHPEVRSMDSAPLDGSRILLHYETTSPGSGLRRFESVRDGGSKWEECRWVHRGIGSWEPWQGRAEVMSTHHIRPDLAIEWMQVPKTKETE